MAVGLKVDADVKALGGRMQVLDARGRDHSLQPQLLSGVLRGRAIGVGCLDYPHLLCNQDVNKEYSAVLFDLLGILQPPGFSISSTPLALSALCCLVRTVYWRTHCLC